MRPVPRLTVSTGNPALDQHLDLLRTFLQEMRDEVQAARASDVQILFGAEAIDPDVDVVVYLGAGGDTVSLPTAKRAGVRKSRAVVFMNLGPGSVTLAAQGNETVDGAATKSVATGVKYRLDPDGDTQWRS